MESQDTWCGKTYLAHFRATAAGTSSAYLGKLQALQKEEFLFLNLREGNGSQQGQSWEMAGAWPGGCWTPSTGESPQRRKRIWLVADFDGNTAGEILFKRKGLRWDTAPHRKEREKISRKFAHGTGNPVWDRKISLIENHAQDCRTGIIKNNIVPALAGRTGNSQS